MTAIIKRKPNFLILPPNSICDIKAQFKIVRPFRIVVIATSTAAGLSLKIESIGAPSLTLFPGTNFPNSTDFFDPMDYYIIQNPYATQESVTFYLDTIIQTNYNFAL